MLIHNDIYEYPIAYFDGAAQRNICACGIHIIPEEGQSCDIYWNEDPGSNSKLEIMALAGLIVFSDFLGIKNLHIYGDSKVTIEHVLSKSRIRNIHLSGWLNWITDWWRTRTDYYISHIPRVPYSQKEKSKSRLIVQTGTHISAGHMETADKCGQLRLPDSRFLYIGYTSPNFVMCTDKFSILLCMNLAYAVHFC